MREIDARGLTCPLPVIRTKNEMEQMARGETIRVLVDNEIAVQNLNKFAVQRGHGFARRQTAEACYAVELTCGEAHIESGEAPAACSAVPSPAQTARPVVAIASREMGQGDPALGELLMKGFLFALTKQDVLPEAVLLYNSGAYLSCEGSPNVEDLKALEDAGVTILTCGTCLNHYGLADKLAVGGVTNLYELAERMTRAASVIRP